MAPWTPGGSPKAGSQEPGCPCGQSGCPQGGLSLGAPGQGDAWASHPTHRLCPWVTGELTAVSTKCCSCSSRVCSWVRFLLPSVAGALRARESVFSTWHHRQVHDPCVAGTLGKFLGVVVLVWVFSHGSFSSNGLFRGSSLNKREALTEAGWVPSTPQPGTPPTASPMGAQGATVEHSVRTTERHPLSVSGQ